MNVKKVGANVLSCLLVILLLTQSIYIPVFAVKAGSDTIQLISAQNSSGNPRGMQIAFSTPVRFADNDPSAHIFASSSGTPATDKNSWNIGLVDSDSGCVAIDPVMIAGKIYASKYRLVFKSDIARTGVIRIIGETSSEKSTDIASICDADGNTLKTDVKASPKRTAAAVAAYEIPIVLLGTTVVSPTQAVLFFNYDAKFSVSNPCDYITADDSQSTNLNNYAKQSKASACEKIDGTRYLITFAGVLPELGEIKIQEIKTNANKSESIVSTSDGSAQLTSGYKDSKGNNIAAASFTNPYMQIVKTEYIGTKTARIYFTKVTKFISSDPASAITATNYGMPNAASDGLWSIPAISITPVDGFMATGALAYEVTFAQNVTTDCNICITGKISSTDFSLHNVLRSVDGKSLYSDYQYTDTDNNVMGMNLSGYKTPLNQTDTTAAPQDLHTAAAHTDVTVINSSSGSIPDTASFVVQQTAFSKAVVIDSASRLIRLYFTSPVHVEGNLFVCDSVQGGQWKAALDTSYAPIYENPYVINGVEYSDTIVVKFGDMQSAGSTSQLYNGNILPSEGYVVIGSGSAADYTGAIVASNIEDTNGNALSTMKYSTETYAKIIKAEAMDKNTARITFSEPVIFQTDSPQNYIHVVQSVLPNTPEVNCISVTPVDGTMSMGATTFDITYQTSVVMPISIKLVEETVGLISDGDAFAIGGLVKAVSGRLVAATNLENNLDTANIAFTVYYQAEPIVTPSVTPTAAPAVTPMATPTVAPEAITPTATPTAIPTATPTVAPEVTPTVTPTATPEVTPTAAPTVTPEVTPTAIPTATPEVTPTGVEPTPTVTPTPVESSPTVSPAPTAVEPTPAAAPIVTPDPDIAAPSVPSAVAVQAVSAVSVSLTWGISTDNTGVTSYIILRNGVQAGISSTNSFVDSGLTQGTAYTYEILACDAAGNKSSASTPLQVTTLCSSKIFSGYSLSGVSGIIDNTNRTISVILPFGTNITNLAAAFILSTGATAAIGIVQQTSDVTANDFTNPVVYIVMAQDGSIQNYTVTVTVASKAQVPATKGSTTDGSETVLSQTSTLVMATLTVDTTAPTITATASTTWGQTNTVTTSITDSESGVALQKWASGTQTAAYFVSGGTTYTGNTFSVTANGIYTVYGKDNAGNAAVKTVTVSRVDTTAPAITTTAPTTWGNPNIVTTTITDSGSGVAGLARKWAPGTQTTAYFASNGTNLGSKNTFIVTENGTYTVYGKDNAGNETVQTVVVSRVDRTAPSIIATEQTAWTSGNVVITTSITDSQSGVALQKWASGTQTDAYFTSSGTTYTGNTFSVTANGTYTVYSKDVVGNTAVQTVIVSHIDTTAPTITATAQTTWGQTNTITTAITDGGSGVALQKWALGTQTAAYFVSSGTTYNGNTFSVTANGTYTVYGKDNAGNATVQMATVSRVDTTAPTITATASTTWALTNMVTTAITETQSGVAQYKWASGTQTATYFASNGTNLGSINTFIVTENGTYTVYGKDNAGNETVQTVTVSCVDTIAPSITATEQTAWTIGNVVITTVITDGGSGVAIQKWASGTQTAAYFTSSGTTYTGNTFSVTANGTYTVYSKDVVGNTAVQTVIVSHIDTTAPAISASVQTTWGQTNTITTAITDSGSGVALQKWASGTQTAAYFTSSGTTYTGNTFSVTANDTYTVYGKDNAGNTTIKTVVVNRVDITAPAVTATASTTWALTNTVTTAITDSGSGVAVQKWALGTQTAAYFAASGTTYTGNTFSVTANGIYTVYGKDTAGNETVQTVTASRVDTTAPAVTASASTTWALANTVTTSITDSDSGVAIQKWALGTQTAAYFAASGTTYIGNTFDVTENGTYTVYGIDTAGNESVQMVTVSSVDTTAPSITATEQTPWTIGNIVIATAITDSESGVAQQKWAPGIQLSAYFASNGTIYTGNTFDVTVKGIYTVYGKDTAGNETVQTITVSHIDTEAPAIYVMTSTTWGQTNTITAKVMDFESGVALQKWASGTQTAAYFTSNGTIYTEKTFDVTANGIYTVYGIDMAGNETVQTVTVSYVDTTAPLITATEQTAWTIGNVVITTVIIDSESGVLLQQWVPGIQTASYFNSTVPSYTGNTFSVTTNGTYTVYSKDVAGNAAVQTVTVSHIDTTAPVITATAQTTWGQTNTITTAITDSESGVALQKWALGTQTAAYFAASGTIYTGNTFDVTENGIYTVYGKDTVGNETVQTVTVSHIDTTAPAITASAQASWGQTNTITTAITDNESGVSLQKWASDTQTVDYFVSGGTSYTGNTFDVTENGIYTVYGKDTAENETVQTITVSHIDTTAPAIATSAQTRWGQTNRIITAITDSESGVSQQKWATGTQIAAYFVANGTIYTGNTFDVTENGIYTVYGKDTAGNETVQTVTVSHIDTTGPVITATAQTTWGQINTVTTEFTENDGGVMLSEWAYGTLTAAYFRTYGGNSYNRINFDVTANGIYTIYAVDMAGNESVQTVTVSHIITTTPTAPTITAITSTTWGQINTITTTIPDSESGVTLQKWASGSQTAEYFVSNGTIYSGNTFTVTANGIYTLFRQYEVKNVTLQTVTVSRIDTTAPVIIASAQTTWGQTNTITTAITDSESGVVQQKWAPGTQTSAYFASNGTIYTENTFNVTANGVYTVYGKDKAGNESVQTVTVGYVDTTTPATTASAQTAWGPINTITTAISNYENGVAIQKWASGSQTAAYFITGGNTFSGNTFDVMANGIYSVYSKDTTGNEAVQTVTVSRIDTTAPTITATAQTTWVQTNTITTTITDIESGVALQKWAPGTQTSAYFALNGTIYIENTFNVTANGVYTVYSRDSAGNESVQTVTVSYIDTTAPAIVASAQTRWGQSSTIIPAIIDNESGVALRKWVSGSQTADYFAYNGTNFYGRTNSFSVMANGIYTIYAKDKAGNAAVQTVIVSYVDRTAPTITVSAQTTWGQTNTITTVITDSESGVAQQKWASGTQTTAYFASNGTIYTGNTIDVTANGIYTVYSKDVVGNETVQTVTISHIDTTAPEITASAQVTWGLTNTITTAIADSESGVAQQKWASGIQTAMYFASNGTIYTGNTFDVTENGTYTVYGIDTAGNESVQTVIVSHIDTQAPTEPTNIAVQAITDSSISISFDSATDNIGVAGYTIYRDGVVIGTSTTTTFNDTNLIQGSIYFYTVAAYDEAGNISGLSLPQSAATLLNAPSNVTATPAITTIAFTWDTVPEAISYDIEINGVIVANISTANYTWNISQPSVDVLFRVRANTETTTSEWTQTLDVACYICVGGVISTDTTWSNTGIHYIVESDLTISDDVTLTILQGTVLLINPGVKLYINGTLHASGILGSQNVISSTRDADYGGTGILSSADYWGGMIIGGDGSFIGDQVLVKYGYDTRTKSVIDDGGSLVLTDSEINNSITDGYAIYTNMNAIEEPGLNEIYSVISTGNTSGYNLQRIAVGGTLQSNVSVINNAFKYVMVNNIVVPEAMTLTLGQGIIMLADNTGMEIYGTLNLSGTENSKVILTSVNDPEYGGKGVSNAQDFWISLNIESTGVMYAQYATIKYAGYVEETANISEAISISGNADISNSEILNCGRVELNFSNNTISVTHSKFSNIGFVFPLMSQSGIDGMQTGTSGELIFENNEVTDFGETYLLHLSKESGNTSITSAVTTISQNVFTGSAQYSILVENWLEDINITYNQFIVAATSNIYMSGIACSMDISNNTMTSSSDAIHATGSFAGKTINISDNTITAAGFGVLLDSSDGHDATRITNNKITAINGVYLNTVSGNINNIDISNNQFATGTDNGVGKGIWLQSSGRIISASIAYNTIHAQECILLYAADDSIDTVTISDNIIESTNGGVEINSTTSIKNITVYNNSFTASTDGQAGACLIIRSSGSIDTVNICENNFKLSSYSSGIQFFENSALSKDIFANFNTFELINGSSGMPPYAMKMEGDAIVNAWSNFWGSCYAPLNAKCYDGTNKGILLVSDNIDYSYWLGEELVKQFNYGQDGGYSPLGIYSQTFSDLTVTSAGLNVDFSRTYNSLSDKSSSFGRGWSFGFEGNCENYQYTYTDINGLTVTKTMPNIKSVNLPDGSALIFTLKDGAWVSSNSQNTLVQTPDGGFILTTKDGHVYTFNTAGYLVSVTDISGNVISMSVNASGKVNSVTDSVGRVYTITYNADGTISQLADPTERTVTYQYMNGLLISVTNALGQIVNYYSYDSYGYLTNVKNAALNNEQTIVYDHLSSINKNKIHSITDKFGNTITYSYENNFRSWPFVDITNGYNFNSNPILYSDYYFASDDINFGSHHLTIVNGVATVTDVYDCVTTNLAGLNYTTSILMCTSWYLAPFWTAAFGAGFTKLYYATPTDSDYKTVIKTDSNGRQTIEWYNDAFQIIKTQDAEGKTTETTYFDNSGNVKSFKDRSGNTTNYEIDTIGNITKIINPDASTKIYTYDSQNNRTSQTDEIENMVFYEYDSSNNLILKAQPINGKDIYSKGCDLSLFAITRYIYYTDAEGTQLGYLAKGLLKQTIDPNGSTTTYTYDVNGYMASTSDPAGNITTFTYNNIGWLLSKTTAKGYTTTYDYDTIGRLVRTTDAGSGVSRYVYDAVGRILQQISPNQYDPSDDGLNLTTPNYTYANAGIGDRFVYDAHGNVLSKTDAANNTTTYTYDLYGNILTTTQSNGAIYTYTFDVMNRQKEIYFQDNAQAALVHLKSFTYSILADKTTQTTEVQYLNATDTASVVSTNDFAGRTILQQNPDGTTTSVQYNLNSTVNNTTKENGAKTYYIYDGLNRITKQWASIDANLYSYTSYSYDKAGNRIQQKSGINAVALGDMPASCITTDSTYYPNGKLKSVTDNDGRKANYYYDADGNLIKTEQYTSATAFNTTESEYNYLEKPVTASVHIRAGDLAGNDFTDNTDTLLTTHFTYDKNGNVLTVTTPNSITTHFTYDNLNRQTETSTTNTDEYGQTVPVSTSVTYTWDGKVQTSTDANGNVSRFVYDKRGLLVQTVDASGNTTVRYYDTAGRLMAIVSAVNYSAQTSLAQMSRTEYTYDRMGRVKTITQIYYDSRTNQWVTFVEKAYQYDVLGNVTKELDALGYASGIGTTVEEKITSGYGTLYTYNLAGKVITKLDPVSGLNGLTFAEKYSYDALGRVSSVTNANGVITISVYDGAGKVLFTKVQTDESAPKQTVQSNTYDLMGNLLTQTDGNGSTKTFAYNALGKVRQTTTPIDASISALTAYSQYNTSGNLARMWTSTGRQETYTYDNLGKNLSKTQSATDGSSAITTSYRYDKNGNLRFATDGSGNVTTSTYDAMNRVLTQTKGGQTTTYTYNANGKALTTTDWRGNTSTNVYDAMNRLIEQKDAYDHTAQSFVYNNNSVQVKSTDALGHSTTYVYDRDNRLLETTDPIGQLTSQIYDVVGNIGAKIDGNGNITHYEYDEFNRLVVVENRMSEWTRYTYDLNGNVLSMTDDFGNVTTYEYNAANQLIRSIKDGGRTGAAPNYTYDLTKVQSSTYTADGQLATKTDRNGITATYTYDIHGRILSQTAVDSLHLVVLSTTYTYDSNGNVLTMTDGTGTTTRVYDAFNRTTSKTVPYIGTSTYNYDITTGMDAGCTAQTTTDPKNNITCKVYDRVGRLWKVTADGKTTVYTYLDNGSVQSVVYSDGSREDYTYTDDNRLDTLTNRKSDSTIIDSYSYIYDAAYNMLTKIDAQGATTYTYDSLNRLSTVTEPSGKVTSYTFDASGNRQTQTVVLGSDTTITTYTYDSQNRLTGTSEQLNGVTTETVIYTYDNNGNQLSKISTAYIDGVPQTAVTEQTNTYDLLNQLISTVTSTGVTVLNTYNGDGRRVGKSVNGTSNNSSTRYLYEYDKVVLEENYLGDQTGRNVYGINLLTRQVGGDTLIYMYNGHADVTALLSITGVIAATYYYDAFGNILDQTGTINNNILYAGYQYDKETGLYYLNARMYDPVTARFMQEDTLTGDRNDPLSLNLYTYCKNEPIRYSDPTGHSTLDDYDYQKKAEEKQTRSSSTLDNYAYQNQTRIAKDRQSKSVDDYYYNKNTSDAQLKAQTLEQQRATITSVAKSSNDDSKIIALLDANVSLYAVPGATDATLAFLKANLQKKGGAINLSAVYDGNASADDIYIRLALQKLTGLQGSDNPEEYYQGLSDVIRYAGGPIIDPGDVMNFDQTTMDGITKAVQVRTGALQTNQVAKFFEDNNATMNMLSDHIGYAATLALGYSTYTERVAADKVAQEKAFADSTAAADKAAKGGSYSNPKDLIQFDKLKQQLAFEEANSIFTESGTIKPEIVSQSYLIIKGDKLNNQSVISALTQDGSNIGDWAKMTTKSYKSPSGDFQVHYYQNQVTGEVSTYGMKAKF